MTETISGQIQKVNYLNDESGFSVVSLKVPGQNAAVTALGRLVSPTVGEDVELTGEFKRHPKYGMQFEVENYQARPPCTESGLRKYLGSGLIKGVGPVLAGRLVEAFGNKVLTVLDKDPARLTDVPGLGPVRRERLIEAWRASSEMRDLLSLLSSYDLGPALATKLLKRYGRDAADVVRNDPYRLSYEIFGVGFLTADKIARRQGLAPDAPQRL